MTVRELITLLQAAPPEAEVRLSYDSGCCYSDARSVEIIEWEPDHIYISTEGKEEKIPLDTVAIAERKALADEIEKARYEEIINFAAKQMAQTIREGKKG